MEEEIKLIHLAVGMLITGFAISTAFWAIVMNIKSEVRSLRDQLNTHKEQLRNHYNNDKEMRKTVIHIDKQLSTLVSLLKGKGVINGD